jgi:hypothetical protein
MKMMMGAGNPYGFTGKETEAEMMKKMFGGMLISVAVEVAGTVVKADASHVKKTKKGGQRFMLVEMDFDRVLADPKGAKKMTPTAMHRSGSPVEFFSSLQGLQGMTLEVKRNVAIQFK